VKIEVDFIAFGFGAAAPAKALAQVCEMVWPLRGKLEKGRLTGPKWA